MSPQSKWEKVPNVAGFYRRKTGDGMAYRFRLPGEQTWTRVPGYPGEQEAKQWRNKQLGLDAHERVKPTKVVFLEYATEYVATADLKERTRRLYQSQIRLHLTPLHRKKLHEIDADAIRVVIGRMKEQGLAGNTIRNTLVALGTILAAAKEKRLILTNPVGDLSKKDRPKVKKTRKRILKPTEAATLISATDHPAFIGVLLFAGLRISEALGLTWADVDLQAREIHVWRQLAYKPSDVTMGDWWTSLKGDDGDVKDRNVEMSNVLRTLLIAHRGDRIPHRDDFVFWTRNATPYSQRNAQRMFATAVKTSGFDDDPKLTPHQCRHNFASALIASGADVGFVADQLGHTDPNVTLAIYRSEFKAARESGSAAAAIDRIYGAAVDASRGVR